MKFATLLSKEDRAYTGAELRPHFLLTKLGLKGSGLAAFIGPCRVETENLVDWEDRLASDRIEARRMIHFLGEFFGSSLREGVLAQRLLMAIALERLRAEGVRAGFELSREGDDLFAVSSGGKRKLSVSIVTASPVSQLLHAGINIEPEGAPVPAVGLAELGVQPERFAAGVLEAFASEWESLDWACAKVRPVVE
jgi:hypothetical protein